MTPANRYAANLAPVTTASERAQRTLGDLAPADRERLEVALTRLREAVDELQAVEIEPPDLVAIGTARARVEKAETSLWRLRGDLLGLERPPWVPSSVMVADWYSDEDRIYDSRA
jgi:predicted aconitase